MQSVLVLGGGSDIGLATVRRLARERTRRVVLAGRSPERLEHAAGELRAQGLQVTVAHWDAQGRPAEDVEAIFQRAGDIDLVLLAAGVLGNDERSRTEPELTHDLIDANFTGPAVSLTACARQMRIQGHGTIVVLSSVAAQRPRRSNFVYGSSKAGLDAFAQGLSDDLVGSAISVLVVRPGFVRTKMTKGMSAAPLAVEADDVADAIAAGLSRGAHTVWVPSALRYVMMVLTHLPRPVFRRLPI